MFRALARDAAQPLTSMALIVLTTLGLLAAADFSSPVLAADPSPLLIDPLDPRAEGEGPGIVGSPLVAALAVLALGVAAALATALYVRLSRR